MFLFYDIETGGLERNTNIYEFGFVRTDNQLRVLSSGTLFFFKPDWDIGASEIHGLTRQYLSQYEKEFNKNVATLYALSHNGTWIGKNNIAFDNIVLMNFMARNVPKSMSGVWMANTCDIQNVAAKYWRRWQEAKTGQSVGRKQGTLENYWEMTGFSRADIEAFMASNKINLPAGRDYLHSALFDAVITLCVAKYCISVHNVRLPL